MSKRAEEMALKAYPSDIYSGGKSCRRAYKEGYEQAIKDVIALVDSNFLPAFAGKIIRLIEQEYE